MSRNFLNQAKSFRLCTWVSDHESDAKTLDYKTLAQRATEALGFALTEHNMRGAIDSLGIERKPKPKPNGALEQLAIAILDLAERMNIHPSNIAAIEQIAGINSNPQGDLPINEGN